VLYLQKESQSFVFFQAAGALLSRKKSIICSIVFKQPMLYFLEESQSFVLFQAVCALI
jgi:hypothetical protein